MSWNCFKEILGVMSYMDKSAPELSDKFWEVRDFIAAWNANMEVEFLPSWINAIDESMSKWLNEYTCSGFIYIPRKPWKFEGKDCPWHLGEKEYDGMGRTVGTLLHLMKSQFGTGKTVVLNSGFCVLQGLVELKKNGTCPHQKKKILAKTCSRGCYHQALQQQIGGRDRCNPWRIGWGSIISVWDEGTQLHHANIVNPWDIA